jgi:hypothetical protein
VIIDDLRTLRHRDRIESLVGVIRTSSVVLAELWRGAVKPADREFLVALEKPSNTHFYAKELAGVR